ncbi:hypothetical protein BDV95DRAFT_124868 [Massariosphaeria phaeospora]|uniref:Uncharacterized protein n=1 Tax=Massariosphaeria phaeospora TaxID=100035 RepID=A0A7C8M547_9PLEO|nr:hypothetical protein BDV95DRAFT_124868 [Massariosphaeria phaeospora]
MLFVGQAGVRFWLNRARRRGAGVQTDQPRTVGGRCLGVVVCVGCESPEEIMTPELRSFPKFSSALLIGRPCPPRLYSPTTTTTNTSLHHHRDEYITTPSKTWLTTELSFEMRTPHPSFALFGHLARTAAASGPSTSTGITQDRQACRSRNTTTEADPARNPNASSHTNISPDTPSTTTFPRRHPPASDQHTGLPSPGLALRNLVLLQRYHSVPWPPFSNA